ncbi:hypothetical protein PR202_ga07315 [Eleusine coracana subsp. coracana]|uniref:MSP domain-containing protein n=1 Tax=Eleusine coracana subsp. coracana TaxID=191504 RepID=A0AAV5BYE8_ELECO|nr:hypothetical protein PR202_ga07315 [Eleusine coracana subsp. coracana]
MSCSVKLTNNTDSYVAYCWKVSNPKDYCVKQNKGILLPRSICTTVITKQALLEAPPDLACKDKFLLRSTRVIEGFTTNDISDEIFRKEIMDEVKLNVVLVAAAEKEKV